MSIGFLEEREHMKVLEFVRADNSCPYADWFDGLSPAAAAKVAVAKARLEVGHKSALKSIGGGLFEYVIVSGPGYRIYLAEEGEELIILYGGGTKRRQQEDINAARSLHAEYKAAKKMQSKFQAKRG